MVIKRAFALCAIAALALLSVGMLPAARAATGYQRYMAHIFQKYGNGSLMSFEGLEHLMDNLGLGEIAFEATHTIDEHRPKQYNAAVKQATADTLLRAYFEQHKRRNDSAEDIHVDAEPERVNTAGGMRDKDVILEFREMHDPKHRHPRESGEHNHKSALNVSECLAPKSLLNLVVDHDDLHLHKRYEAVIGRNNATQGTGGLQEHDGKREYEEFLNSVRITPAAFMKLCPALLVQLESNACQKAVALADHEDHPEAAHEEKTKKDIYNAWFLASTSIFILSISGLLGIILVPLMKSKVYDEILKFLVAVAVGTLCGDAFMHLLPHALSTEQAHDEHSHDHEMSTTSPAGGAHSHSNDMVWRLGCAFAAAILMFTLENLIPLLKGKAGIQGHNHGHGHHHGHSHGHGHGHGHGHSHANGHHHGHSHGHNGHTGHVNPILLSQGVKPTSPLEEPHLQRSSTIITGNPPNLHLAETNGVREINIMLNETKLDRKGPTKALSPIAFMVVIGDGLHNLTDGLAIGAAFASDPVTGLATAFAVLCHELPHELGDFALLLQTGVSMKRAVFLNVVSSVLSFVGMAIGLIIAGAHASMTPWIYAGTAGTFFYIALADLVPTMSVAHSPDVQHSLKDFLIRLTGILLGGLIMLAIAIWEHDLEKLFRNA